MISFINEWAQLDWKRYNWVTFSPIYLEFEWDRAMGGFSATFIFLGIGFTLYLHYKDTKEWLLIEKRIEESGDKRNLLKMEGIYYPATQRLGQFIFNALAKEYPDMKQEDFHERLFYLEDKELMKILEKWRSAK